MLRYSIQVCKECKNTYTTVNDGNYFEGVCDKCRDKMDKEYSERVISTDLVVLNKVKEEKKEQDVCKETHNVGDAIQLTFIYDSNGRTLINTMSMLTKDAELGDVFSRNELRRIKRKHPSSWLFFKYMQLSKNGAKRNKFEETCKTISPLIKKNDSKN